MTDERTITARIMRYLRHLEKTRAQKMHGSIYSVRGLPDIHVTHHGRCLWIEVKRPGRGLTMSQARQVEMLRSAGAVVIVATSVDDVRDAISLMEACDE